MNAVELGKVLTTMCNGGQGTEFIEKHYDEKIVSIEGQDTDAMPARMEGKDAVRGKNQWWYDNHEVHTFEAVGPFVGHRADQFIVQFIIDVTPKDGERMQMNEVGLYTVKGDQIVQEEFLYLMD